MRIFPKNLFIKNLSAVTLRENFLISSIATILVIRVFLKLTGYPSLGGSELHIAHLLWGGVFMLIAILFFISYLSKPAVHLGSIFAGIGFGAFLDELGKFITRDNDYFFQPTIALIYAILVGLYMLFKLLEKQEATQKEYLINALDMLKEAAINDLDDEEKQKALTYLKKANQKDPLVIALNKFLHTVETLPTPSPSLVIRLRQIVTSVYVRIAQSTLIVRSLSIIILIQVIGVLGLTILGPNDIFHLTFAEYGRLYSAILALLFTISGIIAFFVSTRVAAYKLLKSAILTVLLLVEFFEFYDEPIIAVLGVLFNFLLLLVVDYILGKENQRELSS